MLFCVCSYESPAGYDPQGYGGAGGMPNYPGYGPGGGAGPSPQGPPPMMPFSSPMGPAGTLPNTVFSAAASLLLLLLLLLLILLVDRMDRETKVARDPYSGCPSSSRPSSDHKQAIHCHEFRLMSLHSAAEQMALPVI